MLFVVCVYANGRAVASNTSNIIRHSENLFTKPEYKFALLYVTDAARQTEFGTRVWFTISFHLRKRLNEVTMSVTKGIKKNVRYWSGRIEGLFNVSADQSCHIFYVPAMRAVRSFVDGIKFVSINPYNSKVELYICARRMNIPDILFLSNTFFGMRNM